jgi:alpha-glucosidase
MARWSDVNGIYQIYPRSFKDSNGDGVGDLAGITEMLAYIKGEPDSLGVDAVWISPFYRSPMADFGYDVADYYSVDPLFGDLEDFKVLMTEAHNRNIKVMIDYVPNHTSDEHPWFIASRSSRDNDKRDWYVWHDPQPDGSPPNNWLSAFGGSAWQFDETTHQYYLHSFLTKQPDLNWHNKEVRRAMTDVLRFWLDMGVDGIRADAVRWIAKDSQLRDNPPNPDYREGIDDPYHAQIQRYSRYAEPLFAHLKEMSDVIEAYPDRIILFEDYLDKYLSGEDQFAHFYAVNPEVAAPFNFGGLDISYSARDYSTFINTFQKFVGNKLRPFYCFTNHDMPRLVSRLGREQARLVGMLLLALPGIPVVYYGDELGMENVMIPSELTQDPFEKQNPGLGLGRDPQRTPMQWSGERWAGFGTAKPWLPISRNYKEVNVAVESGDASSFLAMYRTLLELRRTSALRIGEYEKWKGSNDQVFGFYRTSIYEKLLVLCNMSDDKAICVDVEGKAIFSTHGSVEMTKTSSVLLYPHQGVIIRQ